jgi:hypothetical protein
VHPLLAQEWVDLCAAYPDALHADQPERVEVSMALIQGQYNHSAIRVAVLVPPGYRATGPDGFLIPSGLVLQNGQALPVSDAAGIGLPTWQLVSFHMLDEQGKSTWHPSADPRRGDNFVGYLAAIEQFLAHGCN